MDKQKKVVTTRKKPTVIEKGRTVVTHPDVIKSQTLSSRDSKNTQGVSKNPAKDG